MGWFSKKSLFAAVAAVAIGFGAQAARAAYTTVNAPGPNPATSTDKDQREVFDAWAGLLGLAASDSATTGVNSTTYLSISSSVGGWTATRIDDQPFANPVPGAPPSNTLNIGLGPNPAGTADQVWSDGTSDLVLKAKYAGYATTFGFRELTFGGGGTLVAGALTPITTTSTEYPGPGADGDSTGKGVLLINPSIQVDMPSMFEFYRKNNTNIQYSRESVNPDGLDHMVTFQVKGMFADSSGNPQTAYAVFFEDTNAGATGADFDYNDTGFLFVVTAPNYGPNPVPLPATAWATMASLAGLGMTRLSRRFTK